MKTKVFAGIVYRQTKGLVADRAETLPAVRRWLASVALGRSREKLPPPLFPSAGQLRNPGTGATWADCLAAAETSASDSDCLNYVIWPSDDEGKTPSSEPDIGLDWPYRYIDHITRSFGPLTNEGQNEDLPASHDLFLFEYCGLKDQLPISPPPSTAPPSSSIWMLGLAVTLAGSFAINLIDGPRGIAAIAGLGRPETWIITVLLISAALSFIGKAVAGRWDGIFIDENFCISLARFQLITWSVLLISAFLTAALSNVSLHDPAPLSIAINAQVWGLLGLSAFTFVAAPSILSQKKNRTASRSQARATRASLRRQDNLWRISFIGTVLVKSGPADARWLDLFRGSETGNADTVDVSNVQKFIFNLLLVASYGASLFTQLGGIAAIHQFPDIDPGFVALLSISHVAYLANLAAPHSDPPISNADR